MPNSPAGSRSLHHIGFIVDSIESRLESFRASLASSSVSEIFHDPIQRTRVVFLSLPGASAALELIEPAAEDSPVAQFLAKGGGLHHLCYEVDDLDAEIARLKQQRAILIRSPKPAVAFAGRRIAWLRTRDALLLELLARA